MGTVIPATLIRSLAAFMLLSFSLPAVLLARKVQIDGKQYIDVVTVGKNFGMQAYWLDEDKTFRMSGRHTRVDLAKNSRLIHINEMPVYLGFPTRKLRGQLFVALTDYRYVLQSVLTPQVFENRPKVRRIAIDAGHGGKDTGARNDAYLLLEKKLTLDVAYRLKTLLEQSGFEVIMIRQRDVYISLDERSRIANRFNADLFVSLHFNAAASVSASGFECFALTPQHQASTQHSELSAGDRQRFPGNDFDPWNMLIAYHTERALAQGLGGPDRGVKRARFKVLKDLDCPGVLVELGFLSHVETARKLHTGVYRQLLARSLHEGVLNYQKRLQRIQ